MKLPGCGLFLWDNFWSLIQPLLMLTGRVRLSSSIYTGDLEQRGGGGGVRGLSPLRVRNPRTTLQLALCVPGSASMNSTKRRSRSETATENKSACKGTHALQSCGVQGPTLFFPEVRSPCLTSKMNYREKWFLISSCHDSARAGAGAPPAWVWPQASPSFAIAWSVLTVSFLGTNI